MKTGQYLWSQSRDVTSEIAAASRSSKLYFQYSHQSGVGAALNFQDHVSIPEIEKFQYWLVDL